MISFRKFCTSRAGASDADEPEELVVETIQGGPPKSQLVKLRAGTKRNHEQLEKARRDLRAPAKDGGAHLEARAMKDALAVLIDSHLHLTATHGLVLELLMSAREDRGRPGRR